MSDFDYNLVDEKYDERLSNFLEKLKSKGLYVSEETHKKNFIYCHEQFEKILGNIFRFLNLKELIKEEKELDEERILENKILIQERNLNLLFSFISYQPDLHIEDFLAYPITYIENLISLRGEKTEEIDYTFWLDLFQIVFQFN